MSGRCERHAIALGPNGCLLCRREASAAAPARGAGATSPAGAARAPGELTLSSPARQDSLEPRQLNIRVPPWALCLPLAALGYYQLWTDRPWTPSAASAAAPRARADAERTQPVAAARGASDEGVPAAASAEDLRQSAGAPARLVPSFPAPEPSNVPEPSPSALPRHAEAARARERAQARELEEAREKVDVTVYFTEWCPACRALRAYLAKRGIRATEHDVDKDRRASSRARRLNPRGSVPTVDIEGQVLVGFNPQRIESAIDRAARSRLARLEQGL